MHILRAILLATITNAAALRSNSGKPKDAVLLSNIETLTLRTGRQTSARRVSSIPQLSCIGGNARGLYDVDIMRCKNSGADYDTEDVQWTCQASLPPEFKLGSTDVICEGYDSPEDPYVLKGSCGVEFRLVLTEKGEEKYGHRDDGRGGDGGGTNDKWAKVIFWAFFSCESTSGSGRGMRLMWYSHRLCICESCLGYLPEAEQRETN